jgi:cell division protein FtsL
MTMDQRSAGVASARWMMMGAQQAARFHRETDRRLRRAMMAALACTALVVGGVVGVLAVKVHQVRLSYRMEALRQTRDAAEERVRLLRVELATLRSLARIEGKARTELGMVSPGRDQVVLAREFVTGGSGISRAALPRTAAVERPRAGESRPR